jgi:hypothetical protein
MGAAYLLPRVVGAGRATQLLMLGDTIDADTADRYGLVSQLVDDDGLDDAVSALAARLAAGPTLAYAQTKALITRELDMPLGAAMELDAMTQALLMTTDDHAEFHAAFNARRPPNWTGRGAVPAPAWSPARAAASGRPWRSGCPPTGIGWRCSAGIPAPSTRSASGCPGRGWPSPPT